MIKFLKKTNRGNYSVLVMNLPFVMEKLKDKVHRAQEKRDRRQIKKGNPVPKSFEKEIKTFIDFSKIPNQKLSLTNVEIERKQYESF